MHSSLPSPLVNLPEDIVQELMEPVLRMVHSIGVGLRSAWAPEQPDTPSEAILVCEGKLAEPMISGLRVRVIPSLQTAEFFAFVAEALTLPSTAMRIAQWAHPMHLERRGEDLVLLNDLPEFVGPPAPPWKKAVAVRLSGL